MEIAELANAIAFLSEKIDALQQSQIEQKTETKEALEEWSQVNLGLMECLQAQSENTQDYARDQLELAKFLLSLGKTTKELSDTTTKLDGSSVSLVQYLKETQANQLSELSSHSQKLEKSSVSLAQYLQGDQAQRLKLLEEGMRSLIEIIESLPAVSETKKQIESQAGKRGSNFDFVQVMSGVVTCSSCTAVLILSLWHFGGFGREIAQTGERSIWAITKLERIESVLGLD